MALQPRKIGETKAQYDRRVGKRPPRTIGKPTPVKSRSIRPLDYGMKPKKVSVTKKVKPPKKAPIGKPKTGGPLKPISKRITKPKDPALAPKPKTLLGLLREKKGLPPKRPKDLKMPPAPKPIGPPKTDIDDRRYLMRPRPKGLKDTLKDPFEERKLPRPPRPPSRPPVGFKDSVIFGDIYQRPPVGRPPVGVRPPFGRPPNVRPSPPRPPDTLGGSPVGIGDNLDINKIRNKSKIFEIADRKNKAIRQQLQRLVSATYRPNISPMAKAQAQAQIEQLKNQLSKVRFPKGMGGDGTYTNEMLYALGVFQKQPIGLPKRPPITSTPRPFRPNVRPPDPLGGRDFRDLNRKERAEVLKSRYQSNQIERMRNYNNARQQMINRFRDDPAKLRQELSRLNVSIRQNDVLEKFRAGLVNRDALKKIGLPPREIQQITFNRRMALMPDSPRKLNMILNFQIREMNLELRERIKRMQAQGATRQEIQGMRADYRNQTTRMRQNIARAKADLQAR